MTMALLPNKIKQKSLMERKFTDLIKVRIKQCFGISVFTCGILLFTLLVSYNPNDPSFRSSTNKIPENILGHFGSHVADPLHLALGLGSFLTALICLIWGSRIFFGQSNKKLINRIIFAPLGLASISTFLSAHPTGLSWNFSYGLGGAFGDEALIWLLELEFLAINDWLKAVTFLLLLISIFSNVYVLGVTKQEIKFISKAFTSGLIQAFKVLTVIPLILKKKSFTIKNNIKGPLINSTETSHEEYTNRHFMENELQGKISEAIATRKDKLKENQIHDESITPVKTRLPTLGGVTRSGQMINIRNGFQNTESLLNSGTKIKKNVVKRNVKSKKAIDEEQPL